MTTAQQTAESAAQRDLNTVELQQRARDFVRDYIAINQKEPTGKLVGHKHGMSDRWGRNQIEAVRGPRAGAAPARQTGTARGTVGEAVAARAASDRSGTDGPATAVIGTPGPAQRSAQPTPPPARTGTPPGTTTGTGSARSSERPTGTGSARPEQPSAHSEGSTGRLVSWLAFAFGAAVSIAANVLHPWVVPPPGAGPDWVPNPSPVEMIMAGVWPTALLLAVEVISRVKWPDGLAWLLARYGGVGAVGLFSAVISYGHLHELLEHWHYSWLGAIVGPLAIDGLMVVAGFALLAISQTARREGRS